MFVISDLAKKKLKRQKFLKFWISSPVVMLIGYKATKSSKPALKPHIASEKNINEHYAKKIVEIDGLRILPYIYVLLNTANADEWLLDVASDGSFVLFADGKLIEPYDPHKGP